MRAAAGSERWTQNWQPSRAADPYLVDSDMEMRRLGRRYSGRRCYSVH